MSGGNSNKSLRKALGSIKDTTTISLAKVKSGYKDLDIAIVRATNHLERPANEKHIQIIFAAISAARPRADVAYCIQALSRRLSKTRNWAVALKTLIVIHRALREVDPTFHEEIILYGGNRSHILNMAHFKDDSSPNAWNFASWVRSYALFLEERLECFRILRYDVEAEHPIVQDLDVMDLLELLPTLQQLLYRIIACQPMGITYHNYVIHLALSLVALDSMKIYNAISEGTLTLLDKFFEMKRHDAIKALDIYRRTGLQADRLAEFYESCKHLDACRGEKFVKIEQRPASLLLAMEDYVRGISGGLTVPNEQVKQVTDERTGAQTVVLAIQEKKVEEVKEDRAPSPAPAEPVKEEKSVVEMFNLLDLDDPPPVDKKALPQAVVPFAGQPTTAAPPSKLENRATGWEVALVTAPPRSNEPSNKLAGGVNKLMLDCQYDDSIRRNSQHPKGYNFWEQQVHDPFFAFNSTAIAPQSMQMFAMANQQQAFMLQQQQQMMMMPQAQMMMPMQKQPRMMMMSLHQQPQSMSQFCNSYGANGNASGMFTQTYNPYSGLL